jgi:hypothetical protein
MTCILRGKGALADSCNVTGIEVRTFAAGQTSDAARLILTYDDNKSANKQELAPASVIIKMSRQDIEGKIVNMLIFLWREVEFYLNFLAMVPEVC